MIFPIDVIDDLIAMVFFFQQVFVVFLSRPDSYGFGL